MPNFGYVPQETVDANGNPVTIAVRQPMPEEAPPEFLQPQQPTTYDQLSPNGLNAGGMSAAPPPPESLWAALGSSDPYDAQGRSRPLEAFKRAFTAGPDGRPATGSLLRKDAFDPLSGPPTPAAGTDGAPAPAAPRGNYPAQPGTGGSGVVPAQYQPGAPGAPGGGESERLRVSVPLGGAGGPRSIGQDAKALNAATAQEKAANQTAYEVGQKQAQAEAGFAEEKAALAEQQRQEQVALQQKRNEAMTAQAKTFQDAQDEVAKVNTTIDPNRYWANKGTGSKFLAAIAAAAGAFAAALTGGKNYAQEIIDKAVSDDIDAQKSMSEMQLKKGNAKVSAAQTIYGMMREKYGDDATALAATHAAAYGVVAKKLEAAKAGLGSAAARADLEKLQAGVEVKRAEAMGKLNQQHEENAIRWAGVNNQRASIMLEAQQKAAALKGADKKNIETVTEIEDRFRNMESARTRLEGLIKKWGTAEKVEPGVESEMNQLLQSIATDSAKLKDPSSIARPTEVEAELKTLYSPGFLQRESSALASLKAFGAQMESRRRTAFEVRGMAVPTSPEQAKEALGAKRR